MNLGAGLGHCALLFALPLSREDYDAASRGEFLPDYAAGPMRGALAAYWPEHEPAVRAGASLAQEAEDLGARVCRRATLADFAAATRDCRVVIVIAHLRGAIFSSADIVDPQAVYSCLTDPMNPLAPVVSAPSEASASAIVHSLNQAIETRSPLADLEMSLQHAGSTSPAFGAALSRDIIDEGLCGLVLPGNLLELADGLHSPAEIADAVDDSFNGELDFTICNSAVLAAVIEMRLCRAIRIVSRPRVILPTPQILATREALRLVAKASMPYPEARLAIERELADDRKGGTRAWLSRLF